MNQLTIYYGNNDYRDYLAHHGILEQEWGKRNGPPYPLDYGDHSAAEKRGMSKKGVRYMGTEGSEPIRKKKTLKERVEEAKTAKIAKKKKKLTDEAIKEGTAANINRNRDLFTPDEIRDITKRMDERAEANRLIQARSSDFRRKAETRQALLEKGNPKKILKNMDKYTLEEINDAAGKIAARQKLTEAIRNERLKAIEAYIQKGASITKSIGDIANNISNIKTAYDKITGANKPSSALQAVLNSGNPEKIIEAINSGAVTAQQGKDALTQAQNKVALQKMIKFPGTDGSGNQVREAESTKDGKEKNKNKNKNKNKQQSTDQTDTKASGSSNDSGSPKDLSAKKESSGGGSVQKEPKKQGLFSNLGKKKSPAQSAVDQVPDSAKKQTTENKSKNSPSKESKWEDVGEPLDISRFTKLISSADGSSAKAKVESAVESVTRGNLVWDPDKKTFVKR